MTRAPDFVIGADYLRRWWVIPRNDSQNVYLHDIRKSDDDRALHDHPWPKGTLPGGACRARSNGPSRLSRNSGKRAVVLVWRQLSVLANVSGDLLLQKIKGFT